MKSFEYLHHLYSSNHDNNIQKYIIDRTSVLNNDIVKFIEKINEKNEQLNSIKTSINGDFPVDDEILNYLRQQKLSINISPNKYFILKLFKKHISVFHNDIKWYQDEILPDIVSYILELYNNNQLINTSYLDGTDYYIINLYKNKKKLTHNNNMADWEIIEYIGEKIPDESYEDSVIPDEYYENSNIEEVHVPYEELEFGLSKYVNCNIKLSYATLNN